MSQHIRLQPVRRDPIDVSKLALAVLRMARERQAPQLEPGKPKSPAQEPLE